MRKYTQRFAWVYTDAPELMYVIYDSASIPLGLWMYIRIQIYIDIYKQIDRKDIENRQSKDRQMDMQRQIKDREREIDIHSHDGCLGIGIGFTSDIPLPTPLQTSFYLSGYLSMYLS